MAQVTVGCPLGELDLRDQVQFQPNAVFHLFPSERPLCTFFLAGWRMGKRQFVVLQLRPQLTP